MQNFFFVLRHQKRYTFLPSQVNMVWQVVVQVRECDLVLCSYWLADDDLVDVVELIPVFISARNH